jgi:sugar diacid utilization regulator
MRTDNVQPKPRLRRDLQKVTNDAAASTSLGAPREDYTVCMTLRPDQLRTLLGEDLLEMRVAGRDDGRSVTCATIMQELGEAERTRTGELAILVPGGGVQDCPQQVLQALAEREGAGFLAGGGLCGPTTWRGLVDLASKLGLMGGLLAPACDPHAIANVINREMSVQRSDPALTAFHSADSLQALTETLGRLIGNSVTIETPRHELMAFTAAQTDVDRIREDTILRRRGNPRVLAWIEREGYMTRLRAADWPIHVPPNSEFDFAGRVAMRVAVDGEMLGVIWITDSARPIGEREYAIIRQAAEAAAMILQRQRATRYRESELRTGLLEDIVGGRISSTENVRMLARSLGWNIDALHQVLVLAIDDFEAFLLRYAGRTGQRLRRVRERLAEVVMLEVLALDAEAAVGPRSTGLVIACDTGYADAARRKEAAVRLGERIVQRVGGLLGDVTVTVGVGEDFASIDGIAESIRQAELAAQVGGTIWGGNRVIHYGDLGVHRVLYALREHDGMIPTSLQRLIDYDTHHNAEFVRTLASYLRAMGKLRPTADELGIHRNTLEYRMQRIQEVAGVDLEDANERLALDLGIRLLDLRGVPAAAATSSEE